MKKIISHLITFLLFIFISLLIFFNIFEYFISSKTITKTLDNINYYERVQDNIYNNIKYFVTLDEIYELFVNNISVDDIKNDISRLKLSIYNNREFEVNKYDLFYELMYKYSSDEEISEAYAKNIAKIYTNNLFPEYPFQIISKLSLSSISVLYISIILFISIILSNVILFLLNKNFYYQKISLLSSAIFLTLPFIAVNVFQIFKDFFFTNTYFSNLLVTMVENILRTSFVLGLLIIFLIFFIPKVKNIQKLK